MPRANRAYLVAAAYLHDIGYSPALRRLGLHQLDGAGYLRSLGHERLARLVAHQSEARFEIDLRGFGHLLTADEPDDQQAHDALTYCDLTTSLSGEPTTLEHRLAEVEARYRQLQQGSCRRHPCGPGEVTEGAVSRIEQRIKMAQADAPCAPTR